MKYSPLKSLQKGIKKRTKETSRSPLFTGVTARFARVGEKILECSYWRGARERERERERESSKLFGTTKLLVQKVAKKFKFPCMQSLP